MPSVRRDILDPCMRGSLSNVDEIKYKYKVSPLMLWFYIVFDDLL